MVGWHHWLNRLEFKQIPRDSEGQGSLGCYSPWSHKESDTTEWLKNYNNPSKTLQTAKNPNILLRVKKLGRRDPSHCFIFPQRWLFSSFILLSLSSSLSISLEISLSSERVSDMWPPRALHRGGFLSCTRPTRKMKVKVAQLSPTLPNPMDYTVHGILQARILKWVTFPFSRGSSQSRDQTQVFRIAGEFFTSWTTREALGPLGKQVRNDQWHVCSMTLTMNLGKKGREMANIKCLTLFVVHGGSDGKESACHVGDLGSIPVGEIPWRRKWQPTPVFLPVESPWTEKPDRLQSGAGGGVTKSRTQLRD